MRDSLADRLEMLDRLGGVLVDETQNWVAYSCSQDGSQNAVHTAGD